MLPQRARIGVIGLGIGRWHIESYLSIPEVKVSAICDIDERKLKTTTIRYGIPRAYKDYEELCSASDVDAVSICVPNYLHASVAIYALKHGKHILCEMPISVSPEEGEKVLEVAKKFPDLKAMVATKFRFSKDAGYIQNMIESGRMGRIFYSHASYLKRSGNIPESWHTRRKLSGGGTLINNGLHLLDLAWWLMGCPKPISAFGNIYARHLLNGRDEPALPDPPDVEEVALGIIRFEDGSSIMFDSSWGTIVDKEIIEVKLCGTRGSASLFPFRITYEEDGRVVSKTPDLTNISSENQFRHFINCVLNKKQPISTIEQGITILKMIDAIYRSAEQGKSVEV